MGEPANERHERLLGRTIGGKYAIESFLGGGAMGAVYRARQIDLERVVAIKVLHSELGSDPAFTARFKREAKAASRLDHPNSVRIFDFGEDPDGLCYIAMELLDGRSLFQVIKSDAPMPPARIVDLLRQVLAALAVAHEMGVVHRDLKPENIVILQTPDDEGGVKEVVKVCDFGIAKIVASRADVEAKGSEKLTGQGSVLGTPEYMSPEQARGEPLDARSDLYSVGVILYELLTGKAPFEAETALGVLLKHIVETAMLPSQVRPSVDRHLEAVCVKAMSKLPGDRFASAREMRTEIGATLRTETPLQSALPMPLVAPAPPSALRPSLAQGDSAPETRSRRSMTETGLSLPGAQTLTAAAADIPRSRRIAQGLVSTPPPATRTRSIVLGALGVVTVLGVLVGVARPWSRASTPRPAAAPRENVVASHTEILPLPPAPRRTVPDASESSPAVVVHPSAPPAVTASPSAGARKPIASAGPAMSSAPFASIVPVTPSSTPPPPPGPFDAARVSIGPVKADHVSGADMTSGLPGAKYNECYREGLRARGAPLGGAGSLHLEIDSDGVISKAQYVGTDAALSGIAQCIVDASTGRKIHLNESAASSAEVELTFKPE